VIELGVIRDLVTIFGVVAGFSYYVLTVRNNQKNQELMLKAQQQTLETRQAQLYNNIWNQSLNNPGFQRKYMKLLSLNWDNIEEYKETFPWNDPDSENTMALWGVALFFQGLAPLIRKELLDIKYIENTTIDGLCKWFWLKLEPNLDEIREYYDDPGWMSDTEYLYNELKKRTPDRQQHAPKLYIKAKLSNSQKP